MAESGMARDRTPSPRRYLALAAAITSTLGWMVLTMVFLGSSDLPAPSDGEVDLPPGTSVAFLGHLLMFGGLGFLVAVSAALIAPAQRAALPLVTAVLLGSLWGVFTEWYQTTVPGRNGNLEDLLIDIVGVAVGGLVAWTARLFLTQYYRRRPVPG